MNTQLGKHNGNAEVGWLFLDLNSFFASCEQQENPSLRGRPLIVTPMVGTDSTCAIAASYEAKKLGIKTGTPVWEASARCPNLAVVQARQKIYMQYHHRVIAAVENCVPVTKVASIDEVACRLIGRERVVENARQLALKIKHTIREQVGVCMTSSIGLAPNMFLGKVASDMQKPDGLVTITKHDLPEALCRLKLQDICGIGPRMEMRLNMAGIGTVRELLALPRQRMRQIWGGVHGVLFHELLHGADLEWPSSPQQQSISHEHVLEPQFRTASGATHYARHLLAKAAERLRADGYYCKHLGVGLSSADYKTRAWHDVGFHETQDTDFLLSHLHALMKKMPPMAPKKVVIVLSHLIPAQSHQLDMFAENRRQQKISPLLDDINRRYGRHTIGFGLSLPEVKKYAGFAAFQRVPKEFEF